MDKKSKVEQISDLTAAEAKHRENAEEFRGQFLDLEASLAKFDSQTVAEIDDVLEGLPDMSAKGLADKVLQIANPKRTQLVENISKLKLAAQNSLRKAGKRRAKILQLEKAINEERFYSEAKAVAEQLDNFINHVKETEKQFETVKDRIRECTDPHYFTRFGSLGYAKSYEVICDSFLKMAYLNSVGLQEVLERIANLGDAYGPPLLKKDNTRLADVPLVREPGANPTWMQAE